MEPLKIGHLINIKIVASWLRFLYLSALAFLEMVLPVNRRGHAHDFFKSKAEIIMVVEADGKSHVDDGRTRMGEQVAALVDAHFVQVIQKRGARTRFEQVAEIIFIEPEMVANVFQRDGFLVMVVDVLDAFCDVGVKFRS